MNSKEGLICPQCMKMFESILILQNHFILCQVEQSHFTKEDSGVVGILKKARKTVEDVINSKNTELFLNISNATNDANNQTSTYEQYISYAFYEEPNIKIQYSGVQINKTDEFIKLRRMKLQSSAIETSNLIMRIEKMLTFSINRSAIERKNFEQTLVEWVEDDLVPMCPSCGSKFGLNLSMKSKIENPIILSSKGTKGLSMKTSSKVTNTFTNLMNFEIESSGPFIKKKHHCRLCGGVICSNCSFMLPYTEANRLLSAINSRLELRESQWQGSGSLTWKKDSETSLDSITNKMKSKEYCIRSCFNCKIQIESKWALMEQRILESDVVIMYKELITEMNKTAQLIKKFQIMSLSISSGETVYSFYEASEMRMDIVKRCQQIDVLGNRFKSRNSSNKSVKESNLFNAICRNAYLFLQNNFATLKYLPTEEEYKERVNNKILKIREEVKNENIKKDKDFQLKYVSQNHLSEEGWAPKIQTNGIIATKNVNLNPFEQDNTELNNIAVQIENVRRYIDQAREGKRHNDIEILQKNMHDLENEYELLQKKLYS